MKWTNCFTSKRIGVNETGESIRSAFERDYDRVIFSSAFRRLQNKTQVFPLPEGIFVHNRLTHSLEVVSVGRSLGKMVGEFLSQLPQVAQNTTAIDFYQNQLKEVISAACLAHDLGNPAFGHSGEEAISKYFLDRSDDKAFTQRFSQAEWQDLLNFEGNANALRILTKQFKSRQKGGYQLTFTTLASLLKYPCNSTQTIKRGAKHLSKYGYFQSEKHTFQEITSTLDFVPDIDKLGAFKRHPFVYLVEAADDICYSIIDFEDAHKLGILSFDEVKQILLKVVRLKADEDFERIEQNLQGLENDPNEAVSYLRAKSINCLAELCAETFKQNNEAILEGKFDGSLLKHNPQVKEVLNEISAISVKRIYGYPSVLKIELAGFKIMSGLIEDFVEAALTHVERRKSRHKKILMLLPVQFRFNEEDTDYEKVMSVLDHISAMTDNYALETYRNLRGISMPSF